MYWHTSVLDQYSLQYGLDASTERLQRHISNVVDWGLGERACKIYQQARTVVKRRVGNNDRPPVIKPKRMRIVPLDDSD